MKNVTDVDSNFKIQTSIDKVDIKFYDVNNEPFKIYGVFFADGKFRRMPQSVAEGVNDGVKLLHSHTAGGRVRFRTDSPYVAISVRIPDAFKGSHFALTGSSGFDLYEGEPEQRYVKTILPPYDFTDGYEGIFELGEKSMRTLTLNLPLYSDVSKLYIGLSESADVSESAPYIKEKPVVFYGSSITQGGCASRPGNSYQSIISRRFDCNYINLGFSGSAKGEDWIAEYIKELDMSVFIYDYDYNAPSCARLEMSHERMFKIIREANPTLPIVIMSRPKYYLTEDEKRRLDIIKATYDNALKGGDKNVYLLDGPALMALAEDNGTVDGIHPNDLGVASMAKALGDLLEKIKW